MMYLDGKFLSRGLSRIQSVNSVKILHHNDVKHDAFYDIPVGYWVFCGTQVVGSVPGMHHLGLYEPYQGSGLNKLSLSKMD